MVQVLLLDLGGTLVDRNLQPLPHVATALEAVASFHTAAGKSLASCLVSDYDLASPFTPAKVNANSESTSNSSTGPRCGRSSSPSGSG